MVGFLLFILRVLHVLNISIGHSTWISSKHRTWASEKIILAFQLMSLLCSALWSTTEIIKKKKNQKMTFNQPKTRGGKGMHGIFNDRTEEYDFCLEK